MFKATGILALVGGVLMFTSASAQTVGTLRWQLRPYCNIVTVTVVQQGGQYHLAGTEDQCGAPVKASAGGLAFQNPNGTIGFGMTIVTAPGGRAVHVDATISLSTLGGTWRDSAGNSGTFVFTPGAGVPGAPRPVPSGGIAPASVTNVQMAGNAIASANIVDGSITSADLAAPPRASFAGGNQLLTLTAAAMVVRTVSLTAPAAGTVIVNASGFFNFYGPGQNGGTCSISLLPLLDTSAASMATSGTVGYVPYAATRGFSVAPGTFTANLVCTGSSYVGFLDSSLTAIFIGQ